MPERTEYAEGVPNWVDLGTPDLEGSKAFYGALLGWAFSASGEEYGGYVTATLREQPVAGMMATGTGAGGGGPEFPPAWSSYVAVADLDASAAKVTASGGTILVAPMDIPVAGRMAFVADPTGAAIGLWQAGEHRGAGIVSEPGAWCWNELVTPDVPTAAAFYEAVFGWQAQTVPSGGAIEYTMFATGPDPADGVAGALTPPVSGIPAYWGVYFAVADLDASVAQAVQLGASVVAPPIETPAGRLVPLADPQGIHLSIIELALSA